MTGKDQFAAFCLANKTHPDFSAKLFDNFFGQLTGPKPKFIWFEASACSGDSISTLNAVKPGLGQILCELVEVRFWNALMPAQDDAAIQNLFSTVEEGGFILAVEGAIATKSNGRYAVPFRTENYVYTTEEMVRWMALRARWVVAVGTCAAFGGPSAARPNPGGCLGVGEVVTEKTVVNVAGCPINPDWLIGTLVHLLLFGLPELDEDNRPTLFYGKTVHSVCQRRSFFDARQFAKKLGDPECMISLGCMGPVTGADCPYRLWNDHLNWPVKASTPCIGCTNPGFPDQSTPFYTPLRIKRPDSQPAEDET